jgi:hypothetical protein
MTISRIGGVSLFAAILVLGDARAAADEFGSPPFCLFLVVDREY